MSVILVTGAGTGIGLVAAQHLAAAGHTVYASMRDIHGRNGERAAAVQDAARRDGVDLRIVQLDVTSQESADAAVRTVIDQAGRLDVVINNAGHLVLGYTEAFTAEELNHLFDVNAAGAHRVNKAVLPHFRQRRHGVLMYIGSTIPFSTPPFFGPYVVSKAAMDSLAVVTSYEANTFGIETVIVMPGAITKGTEHFPNAGHPNDPAVAEGYVNLDPLVARSEEATNNLFGSTVVGPDGVAAEIVRVLDLPFGEKPFRVVIDDTHAGTEHVGWAYDQCRADFVRRMGYGELLRPRAALTAA